MIYATMSLPLAFHEKSRERQLFIFHIINRLVMLQCEAKKSERMRPVSPLRFMSWEDVPHAVFNCTVSRQLGTRDYLIRLTIHSLASIRFILRGCVRTSSTRAALCRVLSRETANCAHTN